MIMPDMEVLWGLMARHMAIAVEHTAGEILELLLADMVHTCSRQKMSSGDLQDTMAEQADIQTHRLVLGGSSNKPNLSWEAESRPGVVAAVQVVED